MRLLPALAAVVVLAAAAGGCTRGEAAAAGQPQHPALAGYDAYDPAADGDKLIAAAEQKAKTENKRVLLIFGGNWCKWCHALDDLMARNGPVHALLDKSFVVVHVDSDTNARLNVKYNNPFSNGFPVILVLDADGTVLHTQETGALEKEDKSVGHDPDKVLAFLQHWAPV